MNVDDMAEHASDAAGLMKALGNESRLMILCMLADQERSVGELNESIPLSQSALSQQLARLRQQGIVKTRRESQTIYYSLADGPEFGFGKQVNLDFDAAIDKVTADLQTEGFGVLSDIDVAAKMKEKLDKDMPRYRILGACNPALADQAIQAIPDIGLLLPCNVLVREDDEGAVNVSFMDPQSVLSLVGDPAVEPLAAEVKSRLERVLAAL
jgi:uncharacterized protein (DUF302 family)